MKTVDTAKISVIVPVYKVEAYLDKCISSIANQTYRNLEIILVDDGSPDNCPAMCDTWAEKDSRIRVIHKTNGGLSDARNAGMAIATGELMTFVDSDDWIAPDMCEHLYQRLAGDNSDIATCGVQMVWEDKTPSRTLTRESSCVLNQEEAMYFASFSQCSLLNIYIINLNTFTVAVGICSHIGYVFLVPHDIAS